MYKFILNKTKINILTYLTNLLSTTIQSTPNDRNSYNNRAIIEVAGEDLQQSLEDMHKAISLTTKYHHFLHYQSSASYYFRAYSYIFLHRYNLAKEDLLASIFQDHFNEEAIKCKQLLEKKSTTFKDFNWIFSNKNNCYLHKLITEFGYSQITALPYSINNATSNKEKIDIFFSLGNYRATLKYINKLLENKCKNIFLYYIRGIIYYNQKKYLSSIKDLKFFIKHNRKNKYALYDLAMAYLMNSQYQMSVRYSNQAFKIDAEYSNAYLSAGLGYFFQKNFKKAEKLLSTSVKIICKKHKEYHITSSMQFYNRGFIYYKLFQFDLAINDLTKALDLHDKNIDALFLRAKIYIEQNNLTSAWKDLSTILSFDNHFEATKLINKIKALYVKIDNLNNNTT